MQNKYGKLKWATLAAAGSGSGADVDTIKKKLKEGEKTSTQCACAARNVKRETQSCCQATTKSKAKVVVTQCCSCYGGISIGNNAS